MFKIVIIYYNFAEKLRVLINSSDCNLPVSLQFINKSRNLQVNNVIMENVGKSERILQEFQVFYRPTKI